MMTKKYYLLFALFLFSVRLFLNFFFEMLPGINGGYNIVQIRSILQNGQLGFPDMPLYFYLNAGIVKLFSLISSTELNTSIIFINKIVDSFCIALTAIPLYFIRKNILNQQIPIAFELTLLAFAMFFFAPLSLTGEFQKNSAAIPLLTGFIYYLLATFQTENKRNITFAALFFTLTALTHFGVFSVAFIILLTSIVVKYKRKAILPIVGISAFSLGLIFLFDVSRALRLLKSTMMLIGGLPRPEPSLFFKIIFLYPVLWFCYRLTQDVKNELTPFSKQVIYTFGGSLFILNFPFMNGDYAMRLGLISFLPFTILLFAIGSHFTFKWQKKWSVILGIIAFGSVLMTLIHPKKPSLSAAAFEDLRLMKSEIKYSEKTLFVAKHGLEWWIAWELEAKVGQSKAIDLATFKKYDAIYTVIEKTQKERKPKGLRPTFQNPYAPENGTIIYESANFKVVELQSDDLLELRKYAKANHRPRR